MEETLLMTGLFVAGAGAGALLSYARDRNLLHLYENLLEDLSRMIPHHDSGPVEPPAAAARIAELSPIVDVKRRTAS